MQVFRPCHFNLHLIKMQKKSLAATYYATVAISYYEKFMIIKIIKLGLGGAEQLAFHFPMWHGMLWMLGSSTGCHNLDLGMIT